MEPTTTTIVQQLGGVKVTVDGVPAMRCGSCGEITLAGTVMIPIDEAIEQILIATGAASPPDPKEEAKLRAENRALTRSLGQGDTLIDEPDESANESASQPSGAGSTAR
jgi:YgiT-type zinc finger domain-containing protein